MIGSDVFRGSAQLGAFLRFVVESVLNGKQDRIKAYTIGVEVLRRNVKFDPQIDPIVRVEATRLRRAIERYYAGPGADDAIIIDLPRGSYVPTFRRRDEALRGPEPDSPALVQWMARHRIKLVAGAAGALFVILALAVMGGLTPSGRSTAGHPNAPAVTASALPGLQHPGMPLLLLTRIETLGLHDGQPLGAKSLFERLRDAFSRFETVNVIVDPRGSEVPGDVVSTVNVAAVRTDYGLAGSIEYLDDRTTTARFNLQDARSGAIIWSGSYERIPGEVGQGRGAEDRIVLDLAAKLLQPFGVIRSHDRAEQLAGGSADPRYRCVIEASDALRTIDPADDMRARACLDRLTAEDATFATGARYRAALELREFLLAIGPQPADASLLYRALADARHAIEAQPENSRGYNTLASVLFARRDLTRSFAASDKAVALNAYDMDILGDYGGRLIASGEIDRGMAMLRRAAGVADVRPSAHHFFLFLGSYLQGDQAAAGFHAGQLTNDNSQLGLLARALVAIQAADRDTARNAFDRLSSLNPAWREDLRGSLSKVIAAPGIVDRLAADLDAARFADRR